MIETSAIPNLHDDAQYRFSSLRNTAVNHMENTSLYSVAYRHKYKVMKKKLH